MAETENKTATDIASELDGGDETTARPSAAFSSMHAGPETLDSIHASSATRPMAGSTMHSSSETQPLGAGWELPDDLEAFTRACAEVKASQAATAASLKSFARGYVEPCGTIAGLSKPTDSERKE